MEKMEITELKLWFEVKLNDMERRLTEQIWLRDGRVSRVPFEPEQQQHRGNWEMTLEGILSSNTMDEDAGPPAADPAPPAADPAPPAADPAPPAADPAPPAADPAPPAAEPAPPADLQARLRVVRAPPVHFEYTQKDKITIVDFLIRNDMIFGTGRRNCWELLLEQHPELAIHSIESIRTTFRRRILPAIENFALDPAVREQFQRLKDSIAGRGAARRQ